MVRKQKWSRTSRFVELMVKVKKVEWDDKLYDCGLNI